VQNLVRIARFLRLEDLLVALVAGVLLPAFERWSGAGVVYTRAPDPAPIVGIVGLVAILGVVICALTRGPDEPSPLSDGQMTFQGWARFPLAAGVGMVGIETLPAIGLDEGPFVALAFGAVMIGALVHPKLPVVPVPYRRALVLPMGIVAAGAFDQIMGSGLSDLLGGILKGTADALTIGMWPLVIGAVLAMYTMLVIAPRSIADPGASGLAWLVRFAFLLTTIALASVIGLR
jgi:hypothetical protein